MADEKELKTAAPNNADSPVTEPAVPVGEATEEKAETAKTAEYDDEIDMGADWDAADFGEFTNSKRVARVNAEMRRRSKSNFSKDIFKCVSVLTVIAVFSGALLGLLNWLTWVDPDTKIISQVAEATGVGTDSITKNDALVINESGSKNTVQAVYEVKKDGELLSLVYYASGSGAKGGNLELLVYLSSSGVIENITVYSQKETAGYFEKVEKNNRKKYVGINITGLKIFKLIKGGKEPADDSEISAVSNATYTSRGYNNAINAVVYAYNRFLEEA